MRMVLLTLTLTLFSAVPVLGKTCISNGGSAKTHVLARFENSLTGELDPFVLGDGGLLVFSNPFTNHRMVIHEDIESAPYATKLKPYAGRNLILGIRKDCLSRVRSRQKMATMEDLKRRVLGIRGKSTYFELTP